MKSSYSPTSLAQRSLLHPKATCGTKSDVFCAQFSKKGELVAGSLSDGSVMVFDTAGGSMVYKLPLPSFQDGYPATAVKFRSNDLGDISNVALVAYSSGHVHQWHVPTGKSLNQSIEKRQTLAAAYSSDSSTYATSGSDCKLMIYDSLSGQNITTLEASSSLTLMDGHMNRVFALRYHPTDPSLLVSGGWDNTVQFWDLRIDHAVRKLSGPHICGDSLDIEPHSLHIATGSWRYDTPLEIWDYGSGKLITQLQSCTGTKLYATCWINERHLLIGGSQKHTAAVIDVQNDKVVGDLKDLSAGVYSVHYNSVNKNVAIASGSKIHICSALFFQNKTPPPFTTD